MLPAAEHVAIASQAACSGASVAVSRSGPAAIWRRVQPPVCSYGVCWCVACVAAATAAPSTTACWTCACDDCGRSGASGSGVYSCGDRSCVARRYSGGSHDAAGSSASCCSE
jgi:hypothetical protein